MTTQNWMEGLSFIADPQGVSHTVGGQDLKFLPVSALVLLKLKGLVSPISECLAVLFDNKGSDGGSIQRTFEGVRDEEGSQGGGSEIIVEAVPKETIELRLTKREQAVTKLFDALTNENNLDALGEVILNSLRKQPPFDGPNKPPSREFVQQVPITTLVELLTGVAKANQGVFGPLGMKFTGIGKKLTEAIEQRMQNDLNDGDSGEQPSATLNIAEHAGRTTPPPPAPTMKPEHGMT